MSGHVLQRNYLKVGGLGLGVLTIGAIAYLKRPAHFEVEITRVTILLRDLDPRFHGFTIAHISDLHFGTWMNAERMLRIAERVNRLQPDVVAITGDFVTESWRGATADITRSLSALCPKEMVVGVLGNHDHHTRRPAEIGEAVRRANVTLLPNTCVAIRRGNATLYLAGVDDIWAQQNDLSRALADIPEPSPVVLLAHEPDFADEAATSRRVGLQLSGHTHGGQVRLPFVGALALPWLGKKYDMGLFNVNGMALYVTRGIGMIPPYIRINCRPEIALLTLAAR